jgi:hypothetical protein
VNGCMWRSMNDDGPSPRCVHDALPPSTRRRLTTKTCNACGDCNSEIVVDVGINSDYTINCAHRRGCSGSWNMCDGLVLKLKSAKSVTVNCGMDQCNDRNGATAARVEMYDENS